MQDLIGLVTEHWDEALVGFAAVVTALFALFTALAGLARLAERVAERLTPSSTKDDEIAHAAADLFDKLAAFFGRLAGWVRAALPKGRS